MFDADSDEENAIESDDGDGIDLASRPSESQVNFPAPVVWVGVAHVCDALLRYQQQNEEAWAGLPSLLDPNASTVVADQEIMNTFKCGVKVC